MDISKTFDIMDHDLLIAKLNAYSFTKESLRLTKGYPSNCWQKKKIKTSSSSWTNLLLGLPT